MKHAALGSAIALSLGLTNVNAATFNFSNTTTAGVQGVDFNYTCNTSDFSAGAEFRMCDPGGNLGGGFPLNKDTASGDEVWTFDASAAPLPTFQVLSIR